MTSTVELDTSLHGGSVWLATIARPERRNALDDATIDALSRALESAAGDTTVRGVVITGSGTTAFCAGSDLKAAREMSPQERIDHTARAQALMRSIEESPCLVVAAVEGYALGGGFELALACDLRVAGATAQFGLPEVSQGMLPTWGGTYRLSHALGLARAQSVLLGGVRLGADEAYAAGLVMSVSPEGRAAEDAVSLVSSLTSASTREAYARAKALMGAGVLADSVRGSALELEAESVIAHSGAYDAGPVPGAGAAALGPHPSTRGEEPQS